MIEPCIRVGILAAKNISFFLQEEYVSETLSRRVQGLFSVRYQDKALVLEQNQRVLGTFQSLVFSPAGQEGCFSLEEVSIGIDFHWERKERQTFEGQLQIIQEGDKARAVNIVSVEKYLLSVISSEMKATSSTEYLKAHAIVSRSWLLAQLEKKKNEKSHSKSEEFVHTDQEWIEWFDREDHADFDVCADDHCQRYQGMEKASTPQVREAVLETRGMVLQYQGTLCDARFYKCCGGITEAFENNWENKPKPYLKPVRDNKVSSPLPDLREEKNAELFIKTVPDSFCNTSDPEVLHQILNEYDLETPHFYRWNVTYSQAEISALIAKRSGIEFGAIRQLIPLERGASGRIIRLKIQGTLRSLIIGKELMIRRILSESHLYSSAFTVEASGSPGELPRSFTLYGAGWGHGTGMCQIGAAVMSHQGYSCENILKHYYQGSQIVRIY